MYESEVCFSEVFYWCYVDVPLVFRGVPLVFRGGLLFHHCSGVFHCSAGIPYSVIPHFGVPGFIVCHFFPLYSIFHTDRFIGRFILSLYKENTKKLSLQSKYKYIKKHYGDRDSKKKLQSFTSIVVP